LLSRSWIKTRIRSKMPVKLRLRAYPGAGWVGRATGEVDAAALEFDEEEHVEAAQRDRLDGEEIAGEHAGGLLAQEFAPAWARASRRGPKTVGKQDPPDRARRHTQAELQQLAGDPRVAPTWVLPCEAQHELSHPAIDGRTARTLSRLHPLATHELPMPAQKRLRRHHQPVATPRWKQAGERRKQSTIGWPQRGAAFLPAEHDELMSQHEQFDAFGELAASAPDQQSQQSPEGEISERKEHAPMFPSPAREGGKSETLIWAGSHSVARPRAIWYSRARVNL
jgi:hypothetical protein